MGTNSNISEFDDLGKLTAKLKNADTTYANLCKAITIIYWILIPVYSLQTLLKYIDLQTIDIIISGLSFILAFLIFAIFFRNYYKEYKYVDYSLPTLEMLRQAEYRYRPFHKKALWIILALILMDIGITSELIDDVISPLKSQLIFLSLMVVASAVGLIVWFIRYKPLRDETLRLIKEIENG